MPPNDVDVSLVVKKTFFEVVESETPAGSDAPARARNLSDADCFTSAAGDLAICRAQASETDELDQKIISTPAFKPMWPATPLIEVGCDPYMLPGSLDCGLESGFCVTTLDNFDGQVLPPTMMSVGETMDDMWGCVEPWIFVPYHPYMEDAVNPLKAWDDQPYMEDAANPLKTWDDASTDSGGNVNGDAQNDAWVGDGFLFDASEWRTTVMLRNLPINLTRAMLTELLDNLGYYGQYDLVYIPVDFSTGLGLGYAFINVLAPCIVPSLWQTMDGFSQWPVESESPCCVSWSDPHQGLPAHIERYRNSPVMHHDVADEWKPSLFMHGVRVEFPAPTKIIKAPKVRPKKNRAERERERERGTEKDEKNDDEKEVEKSATTELSGAMSEQDEAEMQAETSVAGSSVE